jgi:hypothetical protein
MKQVSQNAIDQTARMAPRNPGRRVFTNSLVADPEMLRRMAHKPKAKLAMLEEEEEVAPRWCAPKLELCLVYNF